MGIEFYVDEKVLIPQPDTEILVEEVLKIYEKNLNNKEENNNIKILDICTGSGAIAISISKILKNVDITASDISKDALEIAKKNAINNNVEIEFIKSNMFENINNKYNIIVSNPPYIKTDIIKTLDRQVQNEPLIALDGGEDGLEFYRILVKESKKYLKENGFICMEIGFDQKEEVEKLLIDNNYSNIYCKKDLSENDRIVVANI